MHDTVLEEKKENNGKKKRSEIDNITNVGLFFLIMSRLFYTSNIVK